jgi:hypothetical protein
MALSWTIPENIKKIVRPTGTILRPTKKSNVYAVKDWHSTSINGEIKHFSSGVIGHIIDAVYVPLVSTGESDDLKEVFCSALLSALTRDIYLDLVAKFGNDGLNIFVAALLRTSNLDSRITNLSDYYHSSLVSSVYPTACMSENKMCELIERIGKRQASYNEFMNVHMLSKSKKIAIDGTQQDHESIKDVLAHFGKNHKKRTILQNQIIYVYDLDIKEPVAFFDNDGSSVDKQSILIMMQIFDFKDTFVIMDSGFNSLDDIAQYLKNGLNFLVPLNKNSTIIIDDQKKVKLETSHIFKFMSNTIYASRLDLVDNEGTNNLYVYSYVNAFIAEEESKIYDERILAKEKNYTIERKEKEKQFFGRITFISNINYQNIEQPYKEYDERWNIETFFWERNTKLKHGDIKVHSAESVYGEGFINFIGEKMYCRLKKRMIELGIENYGYFEIIELLTKPRLVKMENKQKYVMKSYPAKIKELVKQLGLIDNKYDSFTYQYLQDVAVTIYDEEMKKNVKRIVKGVKPAPQKRGRKPTIKEKEEPPKSHRGRPPKIKKDQ